jgi:hypothetical protein
VDMVDEPKPETAIGTTDPEVMQILQTQPVFLFIRAIRTPTTRPGELGRAH